MGRLLAPFSIHSSMYLCPRTTYIHIALSPRIGYLRFYAHISSGRSGTPSRLRLTAVYPIHHVGAFDTALSSTSVGTRCNQLFAHHSPKLATYFNTFPLLMIMTLLPHDLEGLGITWLLLLVACQNVANVALLCLARDVTTFQLGVCLAYACLE